MAVRSARIWSGITESKVTYRASPRLKDADVPEEDLPKLYLDTLQNLCTLYQKCKLVHADLSEYNILYHQKQLIIIDVSQSVESDHPHALDFLRSDIKNVDQFFRKRGVETLGLRKTFDLVTTFTLNSRENLEVEVERLRNIVDTDEITQGETLDQNEAVFAKSFIPRTLNEVLDPERDVQQMSRGQGDSLIYARLTGLVESVKSSPLAKAEQESNSMTDSESGSESNADTEGSESFEKGVRKGKRFEDKDIKKVNCQTSSLGTPNRVDAGAKECG